MTRNGDRRGDSETRDGGVIPGCPVPGGPAVSAFSLNLPRPSTIPVLIAVPHAGRTYPPALLAQMRNPGSALLRLEDRYADKLAERVCAATGAGLLIAQAPRAMIDLNRATDDVDWEMFGRSGPPPGREGERHGATGRPSVRRARTGLGLIPRRLPGIGELWKRRHEEADLAERIAGIHAPYHACLAESLQALRRRWGAALLLDLHSMPPLPRQGMMPPPHFVLGDRFGVSSNGSLVAAAFAHFAGEGRPIAHNRPYAGGYVLDRHARPADGINAIQLEIDRTRYLDSRMSEPGDGFSDTVHLLVGLVRRLAAEVAELGRMAGRTGRQGWAEAAE